MSKDRIPNRPNLRSRAQHRCSGPAQLPAHHRPGYCSQCRFLLLRLPHTHHHLAALHRDNGRPPRRDRRHTGPQRLPTVPSRTGTLLFNLIGSAGVPEDAATTAYALDLGAIYAILASFNSLLSSKNAGNTEPYGIYKSSSRPSSGSPSYQNSSPPQQSS